MSFGSIIPRLNYNYSFKDATIAMEGIFKRKPDCAALNSLFSVGDIFFANHARTGLRIALTALNLPARSGIGVSPFNCPTVFEAITAAGHVPVFIDITDRFLLDLNDLEIKRDLLHALIVTHLFGIPNSIKEIRQVVPELPLIEDCAHSFISLDGTGYTGTKGDFGVFSIGKGKFPSVGEGGIILVNNEKYLAETKRLINELHGRSFIAEILNIVGSLFLNLIHLPCVYGCFTLPVVKKIFTRNEILPGSGHREAKILKSNLTLFLSSLAKYKTESENQRENAILNHMTFSNVMKSLRDRKFVINETCNYFMLPLLDVQRDSFVRLAADMGIELGKHFSDSIGAAKGYGYQPGSCKTAEFISRRIVTIPTYYRVKLRNEGSY